MTRKALQTLTGPLMLTVRANEGHRATERTLAEITALLCRKICPRINRTQFVNKALAQ